MSSAATPPMNLDAEESILGACMISDSAADLALEALHPADFYRESHAVVFAAIGGLRDRGEPCDAIAVGGELVRRGTVESAGGLERIHELAALVPAAANVVHYCGLVRDCATRRGLIRVGNDVARLGFDGTGGEGDLLDQAEQMMYAIAAQRFTSEFVDVGQMFHEEYERIVKLYESGNDVVGTPTGFRSLDRLTGGLQGGQLVVLAARPSMGKSALAMAIASKVAFGRQLGVVVFSLEMSRSELMQRLMGIEAAIDVQQLRLGALGPPDFTRLLRAGHKVQQNAHLLHVDDNGAITLPEIRSKLRRHKQRHPELGLVIVDYLQLMSGNAPLDQRVAEVSRISRGLKVLAREIDTPILALSQLNRGPEQRVSDHRPVLSDLRESGSIEQDADIVLFVYRDDYYHKDSDEKGVAEVICAKNRNGRTDTVKLAWQSRYARFVELQRDSEEEPS